MNRRTFVSRMALLALALVTIVLGLVAGSGSASAQIVACPAGTYRVDTRPLGPGACYPLSIRTSWGGAPVIWPAAPYGGPGVYPEAPPVPGGTPLNWVNVCGVVLPPAPGQYLVNCPNGCVICVRICLDLMGCLVIKVYPGPLCGMPQPCP